MIDTVEQTTTSSCPACGRTITQKSGRGHRQRLYCDDRCRQRGHRQRTQPQEQESQEARITALDATNFKRLEQYAMDCSLDALNCKAEITDLKRQVKKLQERLDIETRFRTDTDVRHFKSYLRTHQQPRDTDFFNRFLADTRLAQHASRSMYAAKMRLYGYSEEDIYLFEEAWKDMMFLQS